MIKDSDGQDFSLLVSRIPLAAPIVPFRAPVGYTPGFAMATVGKPLALPSEREIFSEGWDDDDG